MALDSYENWKILKFLLNNKLTLFDSTSEEDEKGLEILIVDLSILGYRKIEHLMFLGMMKVWRCTT